MQRRRFLVGAVQAAALFACIAVEATKVADLEACQRLVQALSTTMGNVNKGANLVHVLCELPPGSISSSIELSVPPAVALTIRGAGGGTATTLNGTYAIPASLWTRSPLPNRQTQTRYTWTAVVPVDNVPPLDRMTQAFVDNTFIPEARWPNANLSTILSLNSWAVTSSESTLGRVVDSTTQTESSSLASTNINWTGALATLNVGDRFTTYTRMVRNHTAGSNTFRYNPIMGNGPGAPARGNVKWGEGGRYFLSGKIEALDAYVRAMCPSL